MYLKALEIQGFKSFPDKIRLSFEKDMTAIVGPNGSGKSNIADAVSWVMGEQSSKNLRGQKMEDVIFGGSGQRGPAAFAQVSLVFDNSAGIFKTEGDETLITRRYYRSGDSEYYINKKLVRLKDINELLMDTGLGRDGYSIIGQGKVDSILSAKSTDRREIFEEAAGISKFRYRKEEAQRKVEKTEENLLRIGDKISELELQLEPLKKQAETAKKYLILRDELRELEISVWMDSLDKLQVRSLKLDSEYTQIGESLESAKEQLELLYSGAEEFSEGMRRADVRADAEREKIAVEDSAAAAADNEAALIEAEIKSNEETVSRILDEVSSSGERENELNRRLENDRRRLDEIAAELDAAAAEKAEMFALAGEQEAEADRVSQTLGKLLSEAAAADSAAAAENAKKLALNAAAEDLTRRKNDAVDEAGRIAERLERETAALKDARLRLEEASEKADGAENAVKGFQLRIDTRRKRRDELSQQLRELRVREGAVNSRIDLLSDMQKEHEGFSNAVKTVMREKSRGMLKNIHGTVAELIKTDDRYTVAIETALGQSLQSIVVSREEDGKAAINLLKRSDSGRATFLPMNTVRGSELSERGAEDEYGAEGIASRLIKYDPQYEKIMLSLLGRTLVAEDMDSAIAISRKYSNRFRIVTLDGQLINAGGSMTGGSAARGVGILSRGNELARLKKEAVSLEEKCAETSRALSAAEKELAEAEFSAESASSELRDAQDELLSLKTETEQREILVRSMTESESSFNKTMDDIDAALGTNRNSAEEAEKEARRQTALAEDRRAQAEAVSRGRDELERQMTELNEKTAVIREKEAQLSAEKESLIRSTAEWESMLESFGAERSSRMSGIEALKSRNAELENIAKEKRNSAEEHRAASAGRKDALNAIIAEKLDFEARRTKADKEAQEKNREINELERQFADTGSRKNAAELEEKQLVDKLWDSYELSRTAAQRLRTELESTAKAAKRISEIKRDISRMGNPNIGAIDEFERVNERYTFLTDQRDDIEKAKKELVGIVNDITEEMKKVFSDEFKAIAESFSETFSELFGGGSAKLLLEDEEDILNCGIEIRVCPPGKTERSLTLLSGGERAFVAIALYFSILKIRPTPFCIVDEIETALDENNVGRFAEYLRKMSVYTQFLIITHRRGTMEEADMLYGVTMQKGISRVIGVDLQEALEKT